MTVDMTERQEVWLPLGSVEAVKSGSVNVRTVSRRMSAVTVPATGSAARRPYDGALFNGHTHRGAVCIL